VQAPHLQSRLQPLLRPAPRQIRPSRTAPAPRCGWVEADAIPPGCGCSARAGCGARQALPPLCGLNHRKPRRTHRLSAKGGGDDRGPHGPPPLCGCSARAGCRSAAGPYGLPGGRNQRAKGLTCPRQRCQALLRVRMRCQQKAAPTIANILNAVGSGTAAG